MTREEKLRLFGDLVESCHALYLWAFDGSMHLQWSSSPALTEGDLLLNERQKQKILAQAQSFARPSIMTEDLEITRIILPAKRDGALENIYVLGPFFVEEPSYDEMAVSLSKDGFSRTEAARLAEYLRSLPVLSLTLMGFGGWALYVRNLMVRALGEDFVLMARARGLSPRSVVYDHAFRTILPPIVTILLMSVPGLVSGAVITETVFSLRGVGAFLLEALSGHDYPAAGASFYLLALITVSCNLLADVVYGLVDPRVRIEGVNR